MRKPWAKWVLLAGPFVTLVNSLGLTVDTVSVPKLAFLSIFAGLALSGLLRSSVSSSALKKSPSLILVIFFLVTLTVPVIFSESPISQQIYGVPGRNLGLLHYLFLAVIFISASFIRDNSVTRYFLKVLMMTGLFEASYGLLQLVKLDPLPWENSYSWVFGTYGNPNYFSSFLAMSSIATLFYFQTAKRVTKSLFYLPLFLFQVLMIAFSKSTQGFILLGFGIMIMLILVSFRKSNTVGISSLGVSVSLMILGLLGTLQKGILSSLLYQESLSFRGDYWRAGIAMFKANWQTGVGLDSYGDYYRLYRDDAAAGRRGLSTLSNSAHNIFIDLASTGGFLLLISYCSLLILVTTYVVRFMRAKKELDFSFQSLVVIWLAFNLQTLISINVSSLAIWGWISGGLIISHVQLRLRPGQEGQMAKRRQVRSFSRISFIAITLCFLLVSPLVFKQVILAEAFRKQDQEKIVNGVLMFPRDADQIAGIATVFKKIGNDKRSIEMAQLAAESNAQAFGAWELMFQSAETPERLRDIAKTQLIALEPRYFNSSFKKSG